MAPSGDSYIHGHEQHIPHDEHHVSSGNSYIHAHEHYTHHDETVVSSGNSYIHAHEHYTLHDKTHISSGNSVGVAFSRRRYTPSYNTHLPLVFLCPAAGNAYG